MSIIRIKFIVLIAVSTMAVIMASAAHQAAAHILPGGDTDHSHDHLQDGEDMFDHYSGDPDRPLSGKLAECAAIYDSAAEKAPEIEGFINAAQKRQFSGHAQKMRDKAVMVARKKQREEPEKFIGSIYDAVYGIWNERWVFAEDNAHYALMLENRQWITYCDKLGITMNILPQFPQDP